MAKLENISDQLEAYAEEAADAVDYIARRNEYTKELAAKVVAIAAMNQRSDCLYHMIETMRDMSQQIGYGHENLGEAIGASLESIADALIGD